MESTLSLHFMLIYMGHELSVYGKGCLSTVHEIDNTKAFMWSLLWLAIILRSSVVSYLPTKISSHLFQIVLYAESENQIDVVISI